MVRKRTATDIVTEIAHIAHHITDIDMDSGIMVTDIIMAASLEAIKAAEKLIDHDKIYHLRNG